MAFDRARTLFARWSKRERDILYSYPRSCDGHWLFGWMVGARMPPAFGDGNWPRKWPENEQSFLKELEERGYDITTLRISVKLRQPAPDREGSDGR